MATDRLIRPCSKRGPRWVAAIIIGQRLDPVVVEPSQQLGRLVVTGKVETEEVREFALRAIEAALLRFSDSAVELIGDGRYQDQIEKTIERVGIGPGRREQREMFRSVFRYVHAALKDQHNDEEAWRTFALASHRIIEAIGNLNTELLPIILRGEET